MARVVARRSNPPYLLIAFVFLFVLTAILSVIFYMKWNESAKALAAAEAEQQEVASSSELAKAVNLWKAEKPKTVSADLTAMDPAQRADTVIAFLLARISKLSEIINVQQSDNGLAAIKQADDLSAYLSQKGVTARSGLVTEVRQMFDEKQAANERAQELKAQVEALEKDLLAANAKLGEQLAKFNEDTAKLTDEVKNTADRQAGLQKAHADELEKINGMHAQEVAGLSKQVDQLTRRLKDLQWALIQEQNKRREERQTVANTYKPKVDLDAMLRQPKGTVVDTNPKSRTVFINRGKNDNVQDGLTFVVFPAGPLKADTKPKGTIEVTSVHNSVSECRIVESGLMGPITKGDVIGNIAYDPQKSFTFFVEGLFDLSGSGKPSRQGAEEVKNIIRRSGGKIADKLTVDVDFVVLGNEPNTPDKPSEDATEQEVAAYNEQMKAVEAYGRMIEQARDLYVPYLNANRFLTLVGYVAPKPL